MWTVRDEVNVNVRRLEEALKLVRILWPEAGPDDVRLRLGARHIEIDVVSGAWHVRAEYMRTGEDTNDALRILVDEELLPRLEAREETVREQRAWEALDDAEREAELRAPSGGGES